MVRDERTIGEVVIHSGSSSVADVLISDFSATGGEASFAYPPDTAVPLPVSIRVGAITRIDQFFSGIVPVGTPGPDTFSYSGPPVFYDLSAPGTVTVVPEPASITLLGIGLTLWVVTGSSSVRRLIDTIGFVRNHRTASPG